MTRFNDTFRGKEVYVRQAFGFFYLQPEEEASALEAAQRAVGSGEAAFAHYVGEAEVETMLGATTLAGFLEPLHYDLTRDGEGRVTNLLRRDGPAMRPSLDAEVIGAAAAYAAAATLVFATPFGDGWEWTFQDGRLQQFSGRVGVCER